LSEDARSALSGAGCENNKFIENSKQIRKTIFFICLSYGDHSTATTLAHTS
jgi:hypothetical protein